jgi:hypothetical protein
VEETRHYRELREIVGKRLQEMTPTAKVRLLRKMGTFRWKEYSKG